MLRGITILLAGLWLVAIGLLVRFDLLPRLLAGTPPTPAARDQNLQYALLTTRGERVGTSWVDVTRAGATLAVRTQTLIATPGLLGPMVHLLGANPVRVQGETTYKDNEVTALDLDVWGTPVSVHVHGVRVGTYFAVMLQAGEFRTATTFQGDQALAIGDLLRPLTQLTGLQVGQSWTVKMIEPFGLTGGGGRFRSLLVRVTGRESRVVDGVAVDCFRVESESGLIAWVDPAGDVVEQQVQVPGLGTGLRMVRERYSKASLDSALVTVPAGQRPELR